MSSRSRHSRSESLSPALFPFLAVLVCTMGALVLILVIVVSQASASAKLTLQAEEDALLETSDMVEVAAEEMKAQRQRQQEAVDNRRSQLAGIEDHIARLLGELKQLEQTSNAIQQQSTHTDQQRAEQSQRATALEEQLRSEQAKLDEFRSKSDNAMPAFAILPYQGKSGTTRRPIYLECTQQGVIIQPEGVVIPIDDLKPPYGPGNPLDASLRLIRSAYQRLDPTASAALSPYPLLLVRPDGIKAYVLARAAMSGWDDQFGYELIDQAMPLAFPPTIPGMNQQLIENLEIARQRQIALIAAMPRRYRSENQWDEAIESIDREFDTGNSDSTMQRQSSSGTDWSSIDNEISSSTDQGHWNMIAELPNKRGIPNASSAQNIERKQPSADQGSPNAVGALTADGLRIPGNLDFEPQGARPGRMEDSLNAPSDGTQSAVAGDNVDVDHLDGAFGADPGNHSAIGQSGLKPFPNAQSSGPPQSSAANATATGNSMSFTTPSNPNSQDISQTVAPASERVSNKDSPTIDLAPRNSHQRSPDASQTSSQPQVRSWTASRRHMNGTMISRSMTIIAMSDRWLLMREDAPQQIETVIPLTVGPSAAGKQLDEAIDSRVESWGVAVAGGYWQPKLMIEYGPKSEVSVQRLQKILQGSGLDMEMNPLR